MYLCIYVYIYMSRAPSALAILGMKLGLFCIPGLIVQGFEP